MNKHIADIRGGELESENGAEGIQVLSLASLKRGPFRCIPARSYNLTIQAYPVSALSNISRQ